MVQLVLTTRNNSNKQMILKLLLLLLLLLVVEQKNPKNKEVLKIITNLICKIKMIRQKTKRKLKTTRVFQVIIPLMAKNQLQAHQTIQRT